MSNEITVARLYNIKKWVARTFNEDIEFIIEHVNFVWGRDPKSHLNRVYIYNNKIVRVWSKPDGQGYHSWDEYGTIQEWDKPQI